MTTTKPATDPAVEAAVKVCKGFRIGVWDMEEVESMIRQAYAPILDAAANLSDIFENLLHEITSEATLRPSQTLADFVNFDHVDEIIREADRSLDAYRALCPKETDPNS